MMSWIAKLKRGIKQNPLGLYAAELFKKRHYERLLKRYDDRAFTQWRYQKNNPGLALDLDHPKRFSEKLQWLKLNYRDERMVVCADKAALKKYLTEQGLAELAVPTIAMYTDVLQIDLKELPERFVLKATHGSGWQFVCRGDKSFFEKIWIKKTLALWLSESLYMYGREWHYRDMERALLVEPLLSDDPLTEYKLMCFHGEPHAVQVNHYVGGRPYVDIYDMQWNRLDVTIGWVERSDVTLDTPVKLTRMCEIARQLAQPFPFVRVDFYDVQDRLYVGELTFFTGGGFFALMPTEYDDMFGEYLTLPKT